jgi:hypothetical protein
VADLLTVIRDEVLGVCLYQVITRATVERVGGALSVGCVDEVLALPAEEYSGLRGD